MTLAGRDRQLPSDARRHGGGGQGAKLQLRTIPAAGAKASCQADGNRHSGWTAGHTRQVS
jgi:hypothetical protein